ncbi:hypothetical protein Nepgr_022773 [Nepenthes gracilis]|uniref:Uncharacterized protein n=1 Tax=Nepenthes gracilis TaxID=150966 RepID=A0AAD3T378_NEPGR|nr:hypothetical protein Nepgr_022773 [Nepenthes gracilis]
MPNKFHSRQCLQATREIISSQAVPPVTYPRKSTAAGNSISKLKISKRISIKNGTQESPDRSADPPAELSSSAKRLRANETTNKTRRTITTASKTQHSKRQEHNISRNLKIAKLQHHNTTALPAPA